MLCERVAMRPCCSCRAHLPTICCPLSRRRSRQLKDALSSSSSSLPPKIGRRGGKKTSSSSPPPPFLSAVWLYFCEYMASLLLSPPLPSPPGPMDVAVNEGGGDEGIPGVAFFWGGGLHAQIWEDGCCQWGKKVVESVQKNIEKNKIWSSLNI